MAQRPGGDQWSGLGPALFISLLSSWTVGLSTFSKFGDNTSLNCAVNMLKGKMPFRRTLTSLRSRPTGILWSSTRPKCKILHLCQVLSQHEKAAHPCSLEGQLSPELHEKQHGQQIRKLIVPLRPTLTRPHLLTTVPGRPRKRKMWGCWSRSRGES